MTAVLTSGAHAKRAGSSAISFAAHRRELGTIAVSIPFFAYTACFLLAPTVIVIVGAFQSADGSFTVANFNKLFEANTIAAFGTSILVSLASSLIGAVVGALASYALVIGAKPNGLLRRMISAISSVLAQFGGVMLAFAFIATIGINGVGTMLIKQLTGYVVMLARGYMVRILLIIPLPQMWLGRQPKGWAQMMFSKPVCCSSIISAVSSQPSPILLPMPMIPSAIFSCPETVWAHGTGDAF